MEAELTIGPVRRLGSGGCAETDEHQGREEKQEPECLLCHWVPPEVHSGPPKNRPGASAAL
jgi:hypothetical protein